MKRVALTVIATGRYIEFLGRFLDSADEHFMAGYDVTYVVFTNARSGPLSHRPLIYRPVPHQPFPYPALHRYDYLLRERQFLASCDYVYHIDVDTYFVRLVGEEILGDLVATTHPGFCESPRRDFTYETRPESRAAVLPNEGTTYFAGGFQGGTASRYLRAAEDLAGRIAEDERRGIMPLWHDESHWNRYLIDFPPSLILPHYYCCPASWCPEQQRIALVDKNHAEMRAT